MTDIDVLKLALKEAGYAFSTLVLRRDRERHERLAAVQGQLDRELEEQYGADIATLKDAEREAETAYLAAVESAALDKLKSYPSGIVEEWDFERYLYLRGKEKRPTGRRGIYEICTRATQFPDNTGTYRRPDVGEVFIRILRKNGTPGIKFEKATYSDWRPVADGATQP